MTNLIPMGSIPTYHALRDPDRPYITHNRETVTRAEFDARANRRARAFAALGIGQDDKVGMRLPNGIAFFETVFGLWKIGATPVPFAPNATDEELTSYLELVQPRAIIGAPAFGSGAIEIPADFPIDQTLSADPLPDCPPTHWRIAMSGGSTGRPKLIIDQNPALADPMVPMLCQTVDGVHINPGPLYHSGPFGLSLRGLFAGSHLVNMDRFDPVEFLGLVAEYQVNWAYLVPTMMQRIWRLPVEQRLGFDMSSLNCVFHMASACPPWLKEGWIEWLGPEKIWELYSSAESAGGTVINGVEWLQHRGSVGKVVPGAKLAIFDEDGRECAPHEVGEIYFLDERGPDAAFRYLGAERKMHGAWQTFGDLGYVDEDGYLYISDRRTDMVVSGGVNIYPAEIESALDSHPDVGSNAVIGLPDDDLGNRVHAIVQLERHASGQTSAEDLRTYLKCMLAGYKVPRSFEFVDEPLRDNAGKVRRSALRDQRIRQLEPAAHHQSKR